MSSFAVAVGRLDMAAPYLLERLEGHPAHGETALERNKGTVSRG